MGSKFKLISIELTNLYGHKCYKYVFPVKVLLIKLIRFYYTLYFL